MQVLFAAGVEHGVWTDGCGAWPGTVERLDAGVLPHMGWNTVASPPGSALFAGIAPGTRFYFVHSYALRAPGADQLAAAGALITWAEHGEPFAAAAEQGVLAAAFGRGSHADLLADVVRTVDVQVEMSGGIRDDASLERALRTGCARVNIGTAALENPDWVRSVIARHGERVAVRLDVRGT